VLIQRLTGGCIALDSSALDRFFDMTVSFNFVISEFAPQSGKLRIPAPCFLWVLPFLAYVRTGALGWP
jgi:hypothetical protein